MVSTSGSIEAVCRKTLQDVNRDSGAKPRPDKISTCICHINVGPLASSDWLDRLASIMLTYVTVLSRTVPKSAEKSQTDENEDAAGDEQPLICRRQKGTKQNHKKADGQQRDPNRRLAEDISFGSGGREEGSMIAASSRVSICERIGLTRIRRQAAICFCLHRGSLPQNTVGRQPRFGANRAHKFP